MFPREAVVRLRAVGDGAKALPDNILVLAGKALLHAAYKLCAAIVTAAAPLLDGGYE